MKKLILLLIALTSISAQELQFGANLSTKQVSIETIIIDTFLGNPLSTTREENFTALSFSFDMKLFFNQYAATVVELGYSFIGESFYEGLEIGIFYTTNKLLQDFYLKAGVYAHANLPDHPTFTSRTVVVSSFGIGWQFFDKVSFEAAYQIPITKTYLTDWSREMRLKNIFQIGFKFIF